MASDFCPNASLTDVAADALASLAQRQRLRTPTVVTGIAAGRIRIGDTWLHNFASNDYLGLSQHSALQRAAAQAAAAFGSTATSSRLVAGTTQVHVDLEQALAHWLGYPAALVFASGYSVNTGVIPVIADENTEVFSDQLNHASLIDGCRLARAELSIFPHADLNSLEQALARSSKRRRLIITESVYSMDGDVVPAAAIADLRNRYGAWWMLDEAHALGAVGPHGRGVAAAAGVKPDLLIGTFGKAFASAGAFVAADRAVVDWLYNRARSMVFSTGLPPATAAAAHAALDIIAGSEGALLRQSLQHNAAALKRAIGVPATEPTTEGCSPIVPWTVGADERALSVAATLRERGFWVPAIRPPTVPEGTARLRISLRSDHHADTLAQLASELRSTANGQR